MRLAGALLLVVAAGAVSLFEYFEADQAHRKHSNAVAEARYRADWTSHQQATASLEARRAKADTSIAACLREIDRLVQSARQPVVALVTGPQARSRYAKLDVSPCDDAVSEDQVVLAGSSATITGGISRISGTTVRRERISAAAMRWHHKDATTALLLSPATAATVHESLRPLLGASLALREPTPSAPAQPVLLPLFGFRYRYLSIAAGLLFGIAGLVLLVRRAPRTRDRGEHRLAVPPPRALPERRPSRLSSKDAAMIAQLRTDLADLQPFLREVFRVVVRLNPINEQVHAFHEKIEAITDQMDKSAVCQIVKSAILEVDLSHAVRDLEEYDETFKAEISGILRSSYAELAKAMPDYRRRIPELPDLDVAADHSVRRIGEALLSTRAQLAVIERHYLQLHEYLPRYEALMTRTGILDFVLGFAAGYFLGSDIASAGAELWDGWRDQSDKQFVESFSRAVDQFSNAGITFTQATEAAVEPVVAQVVGDYADAHTTLIEGLRTLAAGGYDIKAVYRDLRAPPSRDAGATAFFNAVLANLREQGLSGKAERNLMALLGVK